MKQIIRVAVFRPEQEVTFENLRNDLGAMQKIVGGYIEFVHLSDVLGMVCNEEGKLHALPVNRNLATEQRGVFDAVCGTFFVTRSAGGNFIGIRAIDEDKLKAWKPGEAWVVA